MLTIAKYQTALDAAVAEWEKQEDETPELQAAWFEVRKARRIWASCYTRDRIIEDILMAHRFLYYVMYGPVITDYLYDQMERNARDILPVTSTIHKVSSEYERDYTPGQIILAKLMSTNPNVEFPNGGEIGEWEVICVDCERCGRNPDHLSCSITNCEGIRLRTSDYILARELATAPLCRRCHIPMRYGKALMSTLVCWDEDLGGEVTLHAGGPGKLVDCRKCPECGYSIMSSLKTTSLYELDRQAKTAADPVSPETPRTN